MPLSSGRSKPALTSSALTWRYGIALGLVALLSCAAYVALSSTISTQETAAAEINLAGRQRMLSQRLALFCLLQAKADPEDRAVLALEINTVADLLENTHRGLRNGDPAQGLSGRPSAEVLRLFDDPSEGLEDLLFRYTAAARRSAQGDQAALEEVLRHGPQHVLERLDAVVRQYQSEAEARVRNLHRIEVVVLVATLAALCLEAFGIFRPMVARVVEHQNALAQAERGMRVLFEAAQDGMVVLDQVGLVRRANPSALRLLERSEAELRDQFLSIHFQGTNGADWAGRPPEAILTVPLSRDPGRVCDLSFSRLPSEGGERVMVVLRESTERLQEQLRRLERSHRLLDQFAYAASHDLKAPLRAIANLATWIREDLEGQLPGESAQHLQTLIERVQRLEQLIDGLHQYARCAGEEARDESCDVSALARDIHQDADPQGRFTLSLEVDPAPVLAPRALLWQVLANLINNAVRHHGGERGNIVVRAREMRQGWEISVGDDGRGIAPEHHERVWGVFQTVHPQSGGLGIGLALVRRVVEGRGGHVALRSAPGHGACFTVFWPRQPQGVV